jgi:hypothetical protein
VINVEFAIGVLYSGEQPIIRRGQCLAKMAFSEAAPINFAHDDLTRSQRRLMLDQSLELFKRSFDGVRRSDRLPFASISFFSSVEMPGCWRIGSWTIRSV